MVKHANVSAWQRHEEGIYRSEKNGWALAVRWRPEAPGRRRGFLWEATLPTGERMRAAELHEEIEAAMAEAEEAAGRGVEAA
jgi:hypothetical protein